MWRNRKLPIVTTVILGLNLLGLIYEFSVGQNRAVYQYGMYQGAIQDGQWLRLIGYSRPSLFGTYINHYDEHGHKVGRSRESLFGTVHYDEHGKRVGVSHESLLGYENHYDTHGHKVGYTRETHLGKKTKIK